MIFLGFGVLAGMQGGSVAAGLATPWMGLIERVNIYTIMLWVLVLGVALLRARTGEAAGTPASVPTLIRPTAAETSWRWAQ